MGPNKRISPNKPLFGAGSKIQDCGEVLPGNLGSRKMGDPRSKIVGKSCQEILDPGVGPNKRMGPNKRISPR